MLKSIVIIGASAAGAHLARSLEKNLPETHRIILLERLDYMYYPIAALRGSVVPGKEALCFADLDGFFGNNSRHVVLKATSVTKLSSSSVTISTTFEGSNTITFEYAVLALGSSYAPPCRPSSLNKEEAIESLRKNQQKIAAAKKLVIVGGGAVAVELAGEVRSLHAGTQVQIVTSGETLVPGPFKSSLQNTLLDSLDKMKVSIRFNAKVDVPSDVNTLELLPQPRTFALSDGSEVEADLIFLATGNHANTSLLLDSGFPNALDDAKRIKVNAKTLRLCDEELRRYFSLGDCADAPGPKTYVAAKYQAPVVASQILSMLGAGKAKLYSEPPTIMAVPLGPSSGASQVFSFVVGGWITSYLKGRSLFVDDFRKLYKVA